MRTTLNIDDDLMQEVLSFAKGSNRSEAIRQALSDYIALKKRQKVLALRGKIDIEDNWKDLRQMEIDRS